jgi:hypothetical protein
MVDYSQTHAVPSEGLPAWSGPDGSSPPAANLDPGLDIMVLESRGEWAHIRCSNGWEAWVDGRRLIVSQPSPAAAPPGPASAPPPPPQATPPPPPTQTMPSQSPSPSPAVPPAPPTQPVPQAAPPTQPGTPSAAWGTAAAAPGPPRATGGGFRLGAGQIVGVAGGVILFISAWLEWIRFEFTAGVSSAEFSAYKIPAHFLLDSQSELGGLSFGIVVAFFGVVCIATALLSGMSPSVRFLGLVGGALAFLVVVLFLVQTKNLSDALPSRLVESGYFSVLRYGAYIGLFGALLSLVGGILALAQKRS